MADPFSGQLAASLPRSAPRLSFRLSWVLAQELALGPAPRRSEHLARLQEAGIGAVLSLCGPEEAPPPLGLERRFLCRRLVLPDHRSGRTLQPAELEQALDLLAELWAAGPVYVHCLAAVERSPLVCLGWLMQKRALSLMQGLDYLMQVHPPTGPLPQQLDALRALAEGWTNQK